MKQGHADRSELFHRNAEQDEVRMPHNEYPDEVADPLMLIKELHGVIIRQRMIIIICLMLILVMSVMLLLRR